jgi:hypothetical protein
VAHTITAEGAGVLGATYDHRVVNGNDVAAMLRKLSRPDAANKTNPVTPGIDA